MKDVKQLKSKWMVRVGLVVGALILVSGHSSAQEIQNMFLYQSSESEMQNDFIRSNVEGLFEGSKIQKKISDQLGFEMVRLKSMHKKLDIYHLNTLENSTIIDVNFSGKMFSRVQLSNTSQDIETFNQNLAYENDEHEMYALSQGLKSDLGAIKTESYLGMVRCSMYGEEKLYPVFGLKVSKSFEDKSEIEFQIAQEVQGGGSYTGIYGNQMLRKMIVAGRVPLFKKVFLLWDAGFGETQSSFKEDGKSIGAKISTMSASLEYQIGKNVKGSFGYSHRNLIGLGDSLEMSEGHMMSASLAVANF